MERRRRHEAGVASPWRIRTPVVVQGLQVKKSLSVHAELHASATQSTSRSTSSAGAPSQHGSRQTPLTTQDWMHATAVLQPAVASQLALSASHGPSDATVHSMHAPQSSASHPSVPVEVSAMLVDSTASLDDEPSPCVDVLVSARLLVLLVLLDVPSAPGIVVPSLELAALSLAPLDPPVSSEGGVHVPAMPAGACWP